jgi:hypothetical protein
MLNTHLYPSSKGKIRGAVSLLPVYAIVTLTGTALPHVINMMMMMMMMMMIKLGRYRTRYGSDGPAIESRWVRDFPHPSRQAKVKERVDPMFTPSLGFHVVM